jgi:Putative lumazine-binding
MKKYFLLPALFACLYSYAQVNNETEKKAVQETVNHFFEAMEKKDTVLYKTTVFTNGQLWAMRKLQDSTRYSMRYFSDDIKRLVSMKEVIEEKALSYQVNIHNGIAVAWVPYTLSMSGKFSHCGVDVFTLIKTNDGWKIVNASYTIEPDGCADLKKESNAQ